MDKNLHESDDTGLSHSINTQHLLPATTEHFPPALEAAPKLDLLEQDQYPKQNTIDIKITSYTTNRLPATSASLHQHYDINFDQDVSFPVEETRPVPKEKDDDSILQSYQKAQITPTTVEYTAPPVVQTKTKPPPAKTVPSSSGSKSHKSLPRRSCLVYLKEQYHLDVDLLAQPRATKYLVKVRTEINSGYMTKLKLHCSR